MLTIAHPLFFRKGAAKKQKKRRNGDRGWYFANRRAIIILLEYCLSGQEIKIKELNDHVLFDCCSSRPCAGCGGISAHFVLRPPRHRRATAEFAGREQRARIFRCAAAPRHARCGVHRLLGRYPRHDRGAFCRHRRSCPPLDAESRPARAAAHPAHHRGHAAAFCHGAVSPLFLVPR